MSQLRVANHAMMKFFDTVRKGIPEGCNNPNAENSNNIRTKKIRSHD